MPNIKKEKKIDDTKPEKLKIKPQNKEQKILLRKLRKRRNITQEKLAATLELTQSEVSRIEHRPDMYLSTLKKYVEAIGGELHITVKFQDEEINIFKFNEEKNNS